MHCPLTGKPCLMPKEVFVTEVKKDGIRHLFMCRKCGDEYIANLQNADIVTKSLEVVSSSGDISHNERILVDTQNPALAEPPKKEISHFPAPQPVVAPISTIQQIQAVEAKMQTAIDREDYESAATLRDILKDLHDRNQTEENDEEEDEEDDEEENEEDEEDEEDY